MATQQQVLNTILAAQLKAANLTNTNLLKLTGGGLSVKWNIINRIQRGINCVARQYTLQDYSSPQFTTAYDCLLNFVGVPADAAINPNAQNPGITIIINNPVPYLSPMDIPWSAFSPTDGIDGNGGRSTYYNTVLKGINPFMQDQTTTLLYVGTDYDLIPTGGFVLKAGGNLPYIYDGQSLRAYAYQFQGSVPDTGTVRIPQIFIDNSSGPLDLTYLNANYPYPQYIEGDVVTVPSASLQYQRQDNNNPAEWSETPFNYAG